MGYEDELDKAHRYAERVRQKQELNEIRHANDKEKKSLSFSKMAVIFIFANFFIVELYSMVVMFVFHDLTSLGSLIVAVIGQCAALCGYFIKAGRENVSGGITFETAMYELKENAELSEDTSMDDGAVG